MRLQNAIRRAEAQDRSGTGTTGTGRRQRQSQQQLLLQQQAATSSQQPESPPRSVPPPTGRFVTVHSNQLILFITRLHSQLRTKKFYSIVALNCLKSLDTRGK